MRKALGILGSAVLVGLVVAWWVAHDVGPDGQTRSRPTVPPEVPKAAATASGSIPPERPSEPTLAGAPHAVARDDDAPADRRVRLTGRVVRGGARAPIPNATVSLRWEERVLATTVSASDGRFGLLAKAPETPPLYGPVPVLEVTGEGMSTLQAVPPSRATLASGDIGDLVLEPGWTIRGAVRGEARERIAGARVVLVPTPPDSAAEHGAGSWIQVGGRAVRVSDADGHFTFEGMPPRRFRLQVRAEGYVSGWFPGRVVADGAWIDARLRRGHSLRVRVESEDGAPVAGARVNLYPSYRHFFAGHYRTHLRLDRSTVTDAAGRCVLTGLEDRNYQITAQARGGSGAVTYVLPGWGETVVRLSAGWYSRRYAYEGGPGGDAYRSYPPGDVPRSFAWHRRPPQPEEIAAPAARPPPSAKDEAPEPPTAPAPRPPPFPHRARLLITVLSADGVPMPDAHIGLDGPNREGAITEADGTEIVSLSPGRYTYCVSPLDFGTDAADLRGTVDARGGVESRFVFRLPLVHSVPVEVKTADGAPVPRARLEILRGRETETEWTDQDGRILVFAERGQPFSLLSQPDGHPAAFLANVEVPVSRPVVLQAPRARTLEGRVLDPDGAPLFGARVSARRMGLEPLGEERWSAWTDDRGAFALEGPGAASYEVRATHDAFGGDRVHLEVGPRPESLTLRLASLARFSGRLVDERGAPVAGAEVEVREARRGKGHGWVGSGDDGRFEIALPLGNAPVELRVKHDAYATRVVPVPPGGAREQVIRLRR